MAFWYQDTDAADDLGTGVDWANAVKVLETALALMSAGDTLFIQGAAADDSTSNRTLTSAGTVTNPCKLIGVADGTTNEGASVVASDLAVTLPVISTTGAAIDMGFVGVADTSNIEFIVADRSPTTIGIAWSFTNGHYSIGDRNDWTTGNRLILNNTTIEMLSTASELRVSSGADFFMNGGDILFTAAAEIFNNASGGDAKLQGVDLSGAGTLINSSATLYFKARFLNCKMPASYTLFSSTPTTAVASAELIGCSDASSVAATDSIQDYQYEDAYGTIDLETTAVRTGGADDDASGAFSYAMTPHASATLESSGATLKSLWMDVWVDGGANTLTVYIANDSASTDYNENEVWCEFYTPDAGDTAQYDQTFDAGDARLLESTTAVTDDTGSTWGTGANNHQKFSATVTTGYTGWAYARLHLAKRSATPDTLFLDPRIAVS